MNQTQLHIFQRRVRELESIIVQADRMLKYLAADLVFTESMGCAFAFDLAVSDPEAAEQMVTQWEAVMTSVKP